ncbi:MAG TPA: EGF domain-containing protein, partial [Kofleriaceae bacterium]|nr:EGF domain-containing protein [Kofleriaceae bacterium]
GLIDAAVDAPPDVAVPITCGDLPCDPHATCTTSGSNATCACALGYPGDGFTCTDVNECATANGNCGAACQNTDGSFVCYAPQTCADLANHGVTVADTSFTLYLDGLATQPWTAFCAGTGAAAKEYLTLSGTNMSIYQQGGKSPGTDVKTTFTKIRFVVATKKIDVSDRTFATSTGMLNHSGDGTMVTKMPYGVAMNCKGVNDMSTTANFDISATQFAFTGNAAFTGGGSGFASTTAVTSKSQKAKLQGGGNCGWDAPAGAPSNPFNDNVDANNGQLLDLVYSP